MKFDKLQPGMTVYSVTKEKMGNTHIRTVRVCSVKIISVDLASETVMAAWNYNLRRKYFANQYGKWRKEQPLLIQTGISGSSRLATREEIAAEKLKMKEVSVCVANGDHQ